jgi:hypothetical protein
MGTLNFDTSRTHSEKQMGPPVELLRAPLPWIVCADFMREKAALPSALAKSTHLAQKEPMHSIGQLQLKRRSGP